MMELLYMCWEFFKTGLFSIGGGLATLPFLYEMADQYTWFTAGELSDMIAVSESTPGPIGVNMSTYAGYSGFGIIGAVMATFSLVLPSIIVILFVARFLRRFQNSRIVSSGLSGLRPASVGLVAAAGFGILKIALSLDISRSFTSWMDYKCLALLILLGVAYYFLGKKIHPIILIAAGAVAGVILKL